METAGFWQKHGARRVLLDWPLSRREQQHQKTRELARKHRLERSHRRKQRQEGIENSIQNSANKIAAALKEDKERKQAEESLKSLGKKYPLPSLALHLLEGFVDPLSSCG